jgi:hypothetical protein
MGEVNVRKATKEEIRKIQYQLSQYSNDPNLVISTGINFPYTPEEIKKFEIKSEKEKRQDYWKEWEK